MGEEVPLLVPLRHPFRCTLGANLPELPHAHEPRSYGETPARADSAVTALIPVKTYHPPYLREALGSLITQTSGAWRALVVHARGLRARLERDLGSLTADPRITFVQQQGRKLAGALNTGLRHAQTEFAAILLGDDLWAPEAVEVLTACLAAQPEVDFFHSARRVIDDRGDPIGRVHAAVADVHPADFIERGPVKHLLCWRVQMALALGGFDESLNSVGVDDYDFPWSMAEMGARFAPLSECLYVYRDHRTCPRLTTHLPMRTHLTEIRRIMRKHGVPEATIAQRLSDARDGYLRQCMYTSRIDRWWRRALGRQPADVWRVDYS